MGKVTPSIGASEGSFGGIAVGASRRSAAIPRNPRTSSPGMLASVLAAPGAALSWSVYQVTLSRRDQFESPLPRHLPRCIRRAYSAPDGSGRVRQTMWRWRSLALAVLVLPAP